MRKVFPIPLRFLALLACIAVLFYACKDDNPVTSSNPVSVTGTVVDGEGHAVPGAVLEIHDAKPSVASVIAYDTTDDYGVFSLSDLPNGGAGLFVRVNHPYYKPLVSALGEVLGSAKEGRARVKLLNNDSCCGIVALTIVDTTSNTALPGVEVKLRTGGQRVAVGTSDAQGRIVFRNVCAGEYNVRLAKQGFRVLEANLAVDECDSVGFTLRMSPLGTSGSDTCCRGVATVVVRDSTTNAPVTGATVKLRKGGVLLTTLTANGDGLVRFTGLCPGAYSFLILREGYATHEINMTTECNDTLSLEASMRAVQNSNDSCCRGVVHIVVRDSSNNAVLTGVKVKLWQGSQLKAQETSGPNGVVFSNLCAGSYRLSISRDGYGVKEFEIRLTCNDTLEMTKYMTSPDSCCNNRIKIMARNSATGQAIANATVKLWKNGVLVKTLATNSDGYAVFEELCRGEYGVSISREGYTGSEFQVQVSCSSNEVLTASLVPEQSNECCAGVIRLVLRDSVSNSVVNNASVQLWKGGQKLSVLATNGDGVVLFANLCEGRYVLNVSREGYNNREFVVELGCSDTSNTTKYVVAKNSVDTCNTARLKVRVKDSTVADGGWLTGATVVIRRNGVVVADGTTNTEGWYVREGLVAPAEYTVTISKTGFASKTFTFVFNECKTIQETLRIVPD